MRIKLIIILLFIVSIYSVIPTVVERIFARRHFKGKKMVALTFDDGPGVYTESILDLLKIYDIKASFFILSNNAIKYPKIINRMKLEGHEICLHSKDHKCNLFRTYNDLDMDFKEAMYSLKKLDVVPKFYRPPWGIFNIFIYRILDEYKLKKIVWNVMIGDWSKKSNAKVLAKKLKKRVKTGSIICIHDAGTEHGPKNTLEALKIFLPYAIEKEYEFITVGEIYGKRMV